MRTIAIVTIALAANGCARSAPSEERGAPASLAGEWRVVEIDRIGVPDDIEVTVIFSEDGRLSGRSACNRYGGEYSYQGAILTTGALYSTKMACAPRLMNIEMNYLDRLEGPLTAAPAGEGVLALEDDEGRILIRRMR